MYECECRLNENVCNPKQKLNHHKCWYECKESVNWSSCQRVYIRNPSTCNGGCYKMCEIGDYLDIKCKKHVIDSLVFNCNKSILTCENEILNIT